MTDDTMAGASLRIDLWTDLVCPWCYLGKRRLDRAIESAGREGQVELVIRSFELDPGNASTPTPVRDMLARKYRVPPAEVERMEARVAGLAAEEGLPYTLERSQANTFDVHRVAHLAADAGVGASVFDALQQVYFSGSGDPFDHATIRSVAVAAGVPGDEVDAVLAGDAYGRDVRRDEELARRIGITGVPFAALDMSIGISGAQSADVFREAIGTAFARRADGGADSVG